MATKAVQNPVQQPAVSRRTGSHLSSGTYKKTPVLQGCATECDSTQSVKVGDTGLEQPPKTSGNVPIIAQGGAESGAVVAGNDPTDSDLQAVVEQWEDLPEATKDRIAAMLRAAD